jgi:hypothetical protein
MQTATQSLEQKMAELNIEVDIAAQGVETTDGWEHQSFRFALYVGSYDEAGMLLSNAPYSAGMALNHPTQADVFGSVLTDISMVRGQDDWLDFAEEFALLNDAASARKARDDFQEIKARESLLAERLGDDELDALLEIAEEL